MKRNYVLFTGLFFLGILVSLGLQSLESHRKGDTLSSRTGERSAFPNRIICAAPNLVEIVYALGEEDRIVGVSDYTNYPPEAQAKERIGGVFNPNLERILALRPDMMIVQGAMEKHTVFCQRRGIPVLRVDMENWSSIAEGIRKIGYALGCPAKAETLVRDIQGRLDEIRGRVANLPHRPKVFLSMSRRPGSLSGLFTVNRESFIHEMLITAGGVNVFEDALTRYPQISKESLITRAPEIILELQLQEEFPARQVETLRKDWEALPLIPAVATGRIFIVTEDYVMISGPRIHLAAERFYQLIHESHGAKPGPVDHH
ncbi:MAG: ABC transporter substrate-binding protein [Candidatus Omnitrophica bacterium]|nr:ABC transporter substrate-binding protein [Candidatus Omnitrophota bacterium]HPO99213.1 helical backbone metal receptor [bacterium]HXK93963.1 helical backbone metal receptor [bacterium]